MLFIHKRMRCNPPNLYPKYFSLSSIVHGSYSYHCSSNSGHVVRLLGLCPANNTLLGDMDFNKQQSRTARLNSHENFVSKVLELHFLLCNVLFYCLSNLSSPPPPPTPANLLPWYKLTSILKFLASFYTISTPFPLNLMYG